MTIPAGSYYAYFTLRGLTPGNVQINASANGYQPDSSAFRVTTPKLYPTGGGTYNNYAPPVTFTDVSRSLASSKIE